MIVDGASSASDVAAGWGSLAKGDWRQAQKLFREALAANETPEALEGLAWAAYCLDDGDLTLESRERAFSLYRQQGDLRSAARIASWLAASYLEFRGQAAVASGWLQRAHTLLDDLEPGPDHGWLAVHEADIALALHEDTGTVRSLAARAVELGREFDVPELEMVGLALEGRALVSEGGLEDGMRRLDEATVVALAGGARLLFCVGWACCYLISACERVRDFDRAAQWSVRVGQFCEEHGIANLLGICRTHHAGVLLWQGRWAEAEAELERAAEIFSASRPPLLGDVLVRLAELRRQQGRWDEAEELFARNEGHPLSLLGRAALALDRGRPEDASQLADRFLRRFSTPRRVERSAGLEIAVRAQLALGDREGASRALAELRQIAAVVGTRPLQAAALVAQAVAAVVDGDADAARRMLEDSLDLLPPDQAPFERARARLELASALRTLGRRDDARREVEAALHDFRAIGAAREATRAEALLRELRPPRAAMRGHVADGPLAVLSTRELEVLALVARGLTNQEIAGRLVLSEHTVHRHVTNLMRKLGVPSRAAAASLAGRHRLE